MKHGIFNGPLVSDREFKEALVEQWEDTCYGMNSKDVNSDDSNDSDDDDDDDDDNHDDDDDDDDDDERY
jgi:hypothetical protein